MVSIDRKRKQTATMFLRALGIAETPTRTSSSCSATPRWLCAPSSATPPLTKRGRPHRDLPSLAPGRASHRRFRARCSRACSLTRSATTWPTSVVTRSTRSSTSPPRKRSRCSPTRISSRRCATSLPAAGEQGFKVDDIDHFGNRRIRTVGELVAEPVPYRHEPYGARRP